MRFSAALLCLTIALMRSWTPLAQGLQVDLEEFRRLAGEVADLREANLAQQKRIALLQKEVDALREALRDTQERSISKMGDFATREDLKRIVDQISEVDRRRESDRKLILQEFENLGKSISKSSHRREPEPDRTEPAKPFVGSVFPYEVNAKDGSLSQILSAYNADLQKRGLPSVSIRDVQQANPGLNPDRIYVGQKLNLPVPDKK